MFLKVTFSDDGYTGTKYFTRDEWRKRVHHVNSLDGIMDFEWNDDTFYYDSTERFLEDHYSVEEVETKGEDSGDFLDPMMLEGYERDEFEE